MSVFVAPVKTSFFYMAGLFTYLFAYELSCHQCLYCHAIIDLKRHV